MANNKNRVLWEFFANTKNLDKGLKHVQGGMKKTQTFSTRVSDSFGLVTKAAGALGVALGARELLNWAGDAVQLAIAAEEVDSKFRAVFGSATKFRQSLEDWGDVAGVTKSDGEDLAATFGNLAMAQGISAEDTESLTLKVAELAGDLGSFNDADPEAVFFDLNKALLTTEREGMKKYGISLTETEIKQRAQEIATKDGRNEFTKADKALASYQITVEQAGMAIGDLDRTQDSLANRQRRVKASLEEMKEAYGQQLLPMLDDVTRSIDGQDSKLQSLGTTAGTLTASALTPLADSLHGLAVATDDSASMWDRFKGSMGFVYDTTVRLTPALAGVNSLIQHTKEVTVDSDLYMSEFAKGMKETAKAIADSSHIADPYIEFLALMQHGFDGVMSAADTALTKTQLFSGQRNLFNLGGSNAAAAAARAAAATGSVGRGHSLEGYATGGTVPGQRGKARLAVVHGGETISSGRGGSGTSVVVNFNGVVGDPVAVAQQINDLLELADRTGG